MQRNVNTPRAYDASRRREQARLTRDRVLDAAERRFLDSGYAATTMAAVARDADVSVETVYKAFRGKAGLVRAIWERGLGGSGPVPAPVRSDEMQQRETDAHAIVRAWGTLTAEVSPRVSPILLLIRSAAAHDAEMARLLVETDRQRLQRMRANARTLIERGPVRAGITVEHATDVLWTYSSPDLFDLLVRRRRWSLQRYGAFVGDAIAAALL